MWAIYYSYEPDRRHHRKNPRPALRDRRGWEKAKARTKEPGKRKTPGDGTAQEIKTSDLVQQHGNKTFCIRFNKGHCRNAQCKYLHACAIKLPSGEPCGKNHPACQHRNPQEAPSS